MSRDERPYSRHYWDLVDDPKFVEIYDDDHHYATWSRLLMVADQAWPASAHLPLTARRTSVKKLADVELIDLRPGGRFRIHGLDKERAKRSQKGKDAADARWGNATSNAGSNAQSNASASDDGMPRRDETRKDEKRRDETHTAHAPDPADVYWTLTGKYPNDGALSWIDDMSASYGPEPVIKALAGAHRQDRSANTLLGRTQDILRSEARALSLKEQAVERQRQKERRPTEQTPEQKAAIEAEIRRMLEVAA